MPIYKTIAASGSLHIKVRKFFRLVLTRLIDTLHVESESDVRANRLVVMFIFHRICYNVASDV